MDKKYCIATIFLLVLLIIIWECLRVESLREKLQQLQSLFSQKEQQFNSLSKKYDALVQDNNQIKENMQRKKNFSEKIHLFEQEDQQYILKNISKIYYVKRSIMNQPEQKAFYFMSCDLYGTFHRPYCIFPQVNLSAFIGISSQIETHKRDKDFRVRKFFDSVLRNISSKSVDFLICEYRRAVPEKGNAYSKYFYIPQLVVELDGRCHYECWEGETEGDLKCRKENDAFKNILFRELNLKLERIESNESADIKKEKIEQILQQNLSRTVGQNVRLEPLKISDNGLGG
jgi:hypothetical protein